MYIVHRLQNWLESQLRICCCLTIQQRHKSPSFEKDLFPAVSCLRDLRRGTSIFKATILFSIQWIAIADRIQSVSSLWATPAQCCECCVTWLFYNIKQVTKLKLQHTASLLHCGGWIDGVPDNMCASSVRYDDASPVFSIQSCGLD